MIEKWGWDWLVWQPLIWNLWKDYYYLFSGRLFTKSLRPGDQSFFYKLSRNKESTELITIRVVYLSNNRTITYNKYTTNKQQTKNNQTIIWGLTYNHPRPQTGVRPASLQELLKERSDDGSIGKSKDFRSEDAENSSGPNMTKVLVNQRVNYQCTSSGCHKGDVPPNQLEPWLLDLPEGVKKTEQQIAVREMECKNIIFPLHLI